MISRIEARGEEDADVAAYRHATTREVRVVRPSREVNAARSVLMHSFRRVMDQLAHSKVRSALMPWHALRTSPLTSCLPTHRSPYCGLSPAHQPAERCALSWSDVQGHMRDIRGLLQQPAMTARPHNG